MKGGRRQGRQRKRWEDNIRERTGLELAKSKRAVENREKWRIMIFSRNMLQTKRGWLRVSNCCRTPTFVRNQSPMLLLKRTALVALSEVFDDSDKVCAVTSFGYLCSQAQDTLQDSTDNSSADKVNISLE